MRVGERKFHGDRLSEARCVRGLTQIDLAQNLGVTPAYVSSIENGCRKPSAALLLKLTEVLEFPLHYFFITPEKICGTVFYRSMAAATAKQRSCSEQYFLWLKGSIRILRQYVQFHHVNFPQFETPSDPVQIKNDDIEAFAMELRKNWGINAGPISNLTALLENNGAIIAQRDLGTDKLDAFSVWEKSDSTPYFVVNSGKESAARQRFDLAHELGHMLLHRNLSEKCLRDSTLFKLIESQAHYFAGAFLMPEEFVRDVPYRVTLDSLLPVKSKWRVSIQAIIKRLSNLGCISPEREQRLFIDIARRKWRMSEPLDDQLQIEHPFLLKYSFDLLLKNGIDLEHIVYTSLGLSRADVEETFGQKDLFGATPKTGFKLKLHRF